LVVLLCLCGGGCHSQDGGEKIGVGITGIDHLANHLSVSRFYVDGYSAFQAGGGGRHVCCAMLPEKWRPGLTVEIRWEVMDWRDCKWDQYVRRVAVEPYTEAGTLWVHFLANGEVKVVSSGLYAPESPYYPGPHDAIPNKDPWDVYPQERCKGKYPAAPILHDEIQERAV
jgi:hypothetical protein